MEDRLQSCLNGVDGTNGGPGKDLILRNMEAMNTCTWSNMKETYPRKQTRVHNLGSSGSILNLMKLHIQKDITV